MSYFIKRVVSSHAQWCSRKCLGNYVHTRMLLAVLDERALLRSDPCNMNMQDSECGDIPTFTINDRHRKTDSAQRHCLTAINCCFLLTWLYIDHPTRGSGVASSLPTRITTPHRPGQMRCSEGRRRAFAQNSHELTKYFTTLITSKKPSTTRCIKYNHNVQE